MNSYRQSAQTDATGSVANYYSPLESEHNSDIDDDNNIDEDDLYKSKGFADVQATLELMDCIDWKLEKIVTSTGDRIQSIQRKKIGKIYRLTGQVNLPASVLFHRLYHGMENVPSWNPTVLEARVLRVSRIYEQCSFQPETFFLRIRCALTWHGPTRSNTLALLRHVSFVARTVDHVAFVRKMSLILTSI